MENAIRIDVQELIAISGDLGRLVYEMDNQVERLRLVRHRLSDSNESEMHEELARIQCSIIRISEQTEEAARHAMQVAEDFATCENMVRDRFWDLYTEAVGRIAAVYAEDTYKRRR